MRRLIDGHLDLAWNAVSYDRDLRLPLDELNRHDGRLTDGPWRGRATVSLSELRRANCGVVFATLLARSGPQLPEKTAFERRDLDHLTPLGAHAAAAAQLDYYRQLERSGELRQLRTRSDLDEYWREWPAESDGLAPTSAIAYVLTMEGADPILDLEDFATWHGAGLRLLGLAHYGPSRYAGGTAFDGPLTEAGLLLLAAMERLGVALDVTHLCDRSMAEALDAFGGPVLASHHNCRRLVPGDRQLTDQQIRQLVERDAVIGLALDAWMLYPGWQRGETQPEVVGVAAVADHIDHICQLVGNCHHVALGSDLDGGFGREQCPRDLRSIADLHQIGEVLLQRGYADAEVTAIFAENWLRFLRRVLPAS